MTPRSPAPPERTRQQPSPRPAGSEPGEQGQSAGSPDAEDQDGPGSREQAGEPGQDGTAEAAAPGDTDGQQAGDSPTADDGTDTAPDPAVTAEVAGHASQIGAAAQAVTTALQAGDLRAALAGIEEACERAGPGPPHAQGRDRRQEGTRRQARRAARAGRRAPARPPGRELHPAPGGKKLARSSGAVANALDTLVKLGDAELATEKPRSFRLAGNAGAPAGDGAGAAPAGDARRL